MKNPIKELKRYIRKHKQQAKDWLVLRDAKLDLARTLVYINHMQNTMPYEQRLKSWKYHLLIRKADKQAKILKAMQEDYGAKYKYKNKF